MSGALLARSGSPSRSASALSHSFCASCSRSSALELGVDAEAAEEAGEPVERRARGLMAVTGEPPGHGTFDASRETDEPTGVLFEIVPAGQALALGRAHLDPRQQLAEVL